MLQRLVELAGANPAMFLILLLILIVASLFIGYLVGNNKFNKQADSAVNDVIEDLKYKGAVSNSIIENVGLGVLAYDKNGLVYSNHALSALSGFLGTNAQPPRTIEEFLNKYDKKNHLKSNYILNLENQDSVVRANYITETRIYEIKIIHRFYEDTRIDIVIVDDITQIKDDERRQKDLAANVSHELKTPLTVIRASEFFVNSITPEKMPSYEEITKWGNRVVANAVRMQDIVQDFLILSMCSQVVPMTIIDLGEVIMKAVGNLSDYPGRDKVKIITPEEMYYPLIFGNANLIMRIVINLLTNAVKYINYDGKTEENIIRVYVENIGDRIGIQISDNGRGIPQKDIDHLFERFYRVDNSGSHDVGGSGIGLAIAKDVADMHDGTINVISNQGEGAGSTFTLVLPQAAGVFRSVYDDAVTGIVSEEQYYRNAADFMAIQAVEAIRSMGYDDAEEEAKAYENLKEGEKSSHDKVLASLFVKLGEERYTELVDELTYIEPDMDEEFDEDYAEDEGFEEEIIETLEEAPDEAEDETDDVYADEEEIEEDDTPSEEEELRRQKEEARKLLTQPILPRANMLNTSAAEQVQVKPEISTNHENSREKVMIHPISDGKMYNSSGKKGSKKKNGLFDNLTKAAKEETEGEERQSAVRRVLDSIPLIPNAKHDDEGELN